MSTQANWWQCSRHTVLCEGERSKHFNTSLRPKSFLKWVGIILTIDWDHINVLRYRLGVCWVFVVIRTTGEREPRKKEMLERTHWVWASTKIDRKTTSPRNHLRSIELGHSTNKCRKRIRSASQVHGVNFLLPGSGGRIIPPRTNLTRLHFAN